MVKRGRTILFNIIEDDFTLDTKIAAGAALQTCLFFVAPRYVALLPVLAFFAVRLTLFYLTDLGLRHNARADGVNRGLYSARVPRVSSTNTISSPSTSLTTTSPASAPATQEKQVVLFMLCIRYSDPRGRRCGPSAEMNRHVEGLFSEAASEGGRRRYGFLGRTAPLLSTEANQGNVLTTLTYWRSVEGLNRFARESKVHREAWSWFVKEMVREEGPWGNEGDGKRMARVGLMHEMYMCPESVARKYYANFKPFGFLQTQFENEDEKTGSTEWVGPDMIRKKLRGPPRLDAEKELVRGELVV